MENSGETESSNQGELENVSNYSRVSAVKFHVDVEWLDIVLKDKIYEFSFTKM